MKVENKNTLKQFTEDFCFIVDKFCKYIVVSGYVAISTGRTRGTEDIDIILEKLSFEKFKLLHTALEEEFEVFETDDINEMYERLNSESNIRYVYKNTLLPNMEVKFVKSKVDEAGILNRIKIPLSDADVWFAPISSNIAFKETILTSQKDKEDALHLRNTFSEILDEGEIDYFKDLITQGK